MLSYLYVMVGGAVGGGARFWASGLVAHQCGEVFPFGTLVVNIVGSFVIGFFGTLTEPEGRLLVSPAFRPFLMVGVCGGFTTFSSFSLQTLDLAQEGDWLRAGINVGSSVFLCLTAVWLGRISALGLR
jgi:CrcB protein